MSDSIDRVFSHALSTVKKIPKTGAPRPPAADRMRLYGLYKQAMEGDVVGVMKRPTSAVNTGVESNDQATLLNEQNKWDAWHAQSGVGRTMAKRRYIDVLVETMHRYATTPQAVELVAELEFVWNQVKDVESSSSGKSLGQIGVVRGDASADPMRVLSPMSEEDDAEQARYQQLVGGGLEIDDGDYARRGDKWSRKMERAIVRLSVEVAALREQITTRSEWKSRRQRSAGVWVKWLFSKAIRHILADAAILAFLLLWLRRRKDRRLEDNLRAMLGIGREYLRKLLPAR